MFVAAIMALALIASGQDKIDSSLCQTLLACRTVPAFSLTIGDKAFPVTFSEPQPWIADGRLNIFPGESVVLVLKPDGGLRVVSSEPAAVVVDEEMAAEMIGVFEPGGEGEAATEKDVVAGHVPLKRAVPAEALRVTFLQSAGRENMLLTIQNGWGARLSYDAAMLLPSDGGGQWQATSVCTIRPDIYGMEHWPHPIIGLSLGGFAVDHGASADSIICR